MSDRETKTERDVGACSDRERLERLERTGVVRRGRRSSKRPALSGPPPKREPGSPSVLEMLLDERGSND